MNKIDELLKQVELADAIVVGGGSGMSNAAGMDFWYEASPLFLKHMQYYYDKYHFAGIFKGFYTRFDSQEERWAYMIQMLNLIFNEPAQNQPTIIKKRSLAINLPTTSRLTKMVCSRSTLVKMPSVKSKVHGSSSKALTLKSIRIFIQLSHMLKIYSIRSKITNLIKNTFLRARSMGIPLSRGCADQNF